MVIDNLTRNELTEKLATNLPTLRAKMRISQAELAEAVGIGRQTLISIENKTGKMRWDTFLAILLVFSQNSEAIELLSFWDLNLDAICSEIGDGLFNKKGLSSPRIKFWTLNHNSDQISFRGYVPLPVGLHETKCPQCQSSNLTGILITPTSDEQDPNIVCLNCGFWWD